MKNIGSQLMGVLSSIGRIIGKMQTLNTGILSKKTYFL